MSKIKISASFVLAILCTLGSKSLTAANLAKVEQRGILEVAVYKDFPPYSYVEAGKTRGIDVEVGRALARELGVNASIRLIGADENMGDDLRNNVWKGHYLGGGTADVMLHVPVNDQFAEDNDLVKIQAPYYEEEIIIAQHPKRTENATTLAVFTQMKVGVELDTLADFHLLSTLGGRLRNNVVHFTSITQAVQAMKAGKVVAVAGPRGEIEAALGTDKGQYTLGQIPLNGLFNRSWKLGMAVKAKNKQLASSLANAMKKLLSSGVVVKIFKDYQVSYQAP